MQGDFNPNETNYASQGIDSYEKENNENLKEELELMIGFLSEEGTIERFGISKEEFQNPTEDTLEKIKQVLIEEQTTKKL